MLKRTYVQCAYLLSWVVFGLGAIALNLGCLVLRLWPKPERFGGAVRRAIRGLFRVWIGWLDATGLVKIEWDGTAADRLDGPAVYVANHPSLLDATFLLAYVPDAVTVFKPALLDNPFLGPAARIAGYAPGDQGVDLIRRLAAEAGQGRNVLIFPEGTRTGRSVVCNPLKSGFALIARRAGVPIHILRIEASRDLLPRGGIWWRAPRAPSRYVIRTAGTLAAPVDRDVADVVAEVGERLSAGAAAVP